MGVAFPSLIPEINCDVGRCIFETLTALAGHQPDLNLIDSGNAAFTLAFGTGFNRVYNGL